MQIRLLYKRCFVALAALAPTILGLLAGPSGAAAAGCPNEAFRTGASAGLPDCRAYEKVSPAEKGGADPQSTPFGPTPFGFQAATNGEAVIYSSAGGVFAGSKSAAAIISYRAERTPSGWVTQGIDPQAEVAFPSLQIEHSFFTANLSAGIFLSLTPLTGSAGEGGIYRAGFEPESIQQLAPGPLGNVEIVVASSDGESIAYAPAGRPLEFFTDGALETVAIPGGSEYKIGGGTFGGGGAKTAISGDGSRLYFAAEAAGSPSQIYLREGGASTLVSEPNEGVSDPKGPRPATFYWATPDGGRALFTSAAKLTADATTGPNDEGSDLYEFDATAPAGHRLRDLTVDSAEPAGARVRYVLGAGENGNYVYFTAQGRINGEGTAGEENLYVWQGGTTTFIATVGSSELLQIPTQVTEEKFQITPNGQNLVFQTSHEQPGYKNAGHSEVYLYDAATAELHCVSCNPSGEPATANSTISSGNAFFAHAPAHPLNVTYEGSKGTRVFFDSDEALVEADTNGQEDVYEYEDGAPRLISTGTGSEASTLMGASADGRDVFFATRQRLTAAADDDLADVYDAREEGGLVEPVPGGASACVGEGCRAPLDGASTALKPGTSLVGGAGNVRHRKHHAKKYQHHKAKAKKGKSNHYQKGKRSKRIPGTRNRGGAK